MSRRSTVLASLVVLMVSALLVAADRPILPDGVRGFAGTLTGTVVSAQENGQGLVLHVTAVKPADAGKAPKPEAAVGQDLLINQDDRGRAGRHAQLLNGAQV